LSKLCRNNAKKINIVIITTILAWLILYEAIPLAQCSVTPLSPSIGVSPHSVSINEEATVSVIIAVTETSNVTATRPILNGVGDAQLVSENTSIIITPDLDGTVQVGTLQWVYRASQPGTVNFTTTITVTRLSDQKVTLTQTVKSSDVGILKFADFLLLGAAILTLYILITAWFSEPKSKMSYFQLSGGWTGILYSIFFSLLGALFALIFNLVLDSRISVLLLGIVLFVFGLACCMVDSKFRKLTGIGKKKTESSSKDQDITKRSPLTELTGVYIVMFGLIGFFVAYEVWSGVVIIILLGIMAAAKEVMEMNMK
jgi:hypothetical protein